jgi:hypothetical protein
MRFQIIGNGKELFIWSLYMIEDLTKQEVERHFHAGANAEDSETAKIGGVVTQSSLF